MRSLFDGRSILQQTRCAETCQQFVDLEHDRGELHSRRRQIGDRRGRRYLTRFTLRARGTGGADFTRGSLRAGGASSACCASSAGGTGSAGRTSCTGRTGSTDSARGAGGAGQALNALHALDTLNALGSRGTHGAGGAGGTDVRHRAAADAAGIEALAATAAIVVICRAVHAAAILKTIDIDHPLCESTGISPAALFYAGAEKG